MSGEGLNARVGIVAELDTSSMEAPRLIGEVAAEFPGLSTAGFFAEVWWSFYPRIDEVDIKAEALHMVNMGDLKYTSDYKVYLPN